MKTIDGFGKVDGGKYGIMSLGLCLSLLLIFNSISSIAGNQIKIKELKGSWKFSIGDKSEWNSVKYDDGDWEEIMVPSPWEEQGFHGYDGYAWYRKWFTLPAGYENSTFYLHLGYVDDVDMVYVNGKMIGYTGSFPPSYSTAYNANRIYPIPKEIIKTNEKNLIAVKVYDAGLAGGIVSGDIGIYIDPDQMPLNINLEGIWKFHTGDKLAWSDPATDDSNWHNIIVPNLWENQGYRYYDGFAWYRKSFYVPADLTQVRIVVVMGKIDDIDEVYLNGRLINPVKKLRGEDEPVETNSTDYAQFRAYYIEGSLLKPNQQNTIAVRVYDGGGGGGIYEGPVGIIKQKDFVQYWRNKNNK